MSRKFLVMALLALAIVLPWMLGGLGLSMLNQVYLNAMVALGLVLLTGVVGLISFGQMAFVGLAAYATGYLCVAWGWSPWLGLPAGLALCALVALVVGLLTLRMGGHYLAIATLAWGLSIYYLFGNLQSLGGFSGFGDIPPIAIGPWVLASDGAMQALILASLVAMVALCANLLDSRIGRALRAVRAGAQLPESVGVDVQRLKRGVFVLAALFAGWSGWLQAHWQRFISPSPFNLEMGIEYLFMAVIGGIADLPGALLGAAVVTLLKSWLQDWLTAWSGQAGSFEIVVFGALMLLILQRARGGLWPLLARLLPPRAPRLVGAPCALPSARTRPAPGTPVLQVDAVRRTFGGLVAVRDVSFEVRAGQVLGLLGPNGAGKSTMFNLISGVLPLSAGAVRFAGERIDGRTSAHIARLGVARTFQHVKIARGMTLLENVVLGTWTRSRAGWLKSALRMNRAEEAALFADAAWQLHRVGLAESAHALAGALPLGKQRLLEIARALAADPVLLLLDEPAAGLRALEKRALGELLVRLRGEGVAILLVEHDMEFVMSVADELVVMNFGERLAMGRPHDVQRDPAVLEAYLGRAQ